MRLRAPALALLLGAIAFGGCRSKSIAYERSGAVIIGLPEGRSRIARGDPSDGIFEHEEPGKWRASLSWEPDPRAGPVSDEEALLAAGIAHGELVQHAKSLRELTSTDADAAEKNAQSTTVIDGHAAARVRGPNSEALVWRCDNTRRLFTLLREEDDPGEHALPLSLDEMAATAGCHDFRSKPANAQIPAANLVALGEGWTLGKRTPDSTIYLRGDALLEVFAGRRTEPADDLVLAAHLAPAWIEAAGLHDAHVEAGEHTQGPQGHPAVVMRGEAVLDGRAVRWSYLEWRCLQRARTYGALVVSEALADPKEAPKAGGWTGHDSALLAVRCHG